MANDGPLTIAQVAYRLRMSKGTISRMAHRGDLLYWVTPGGHRRFQAEHIDHYAAKHHIPVTP